MIPAATTTITVRRVPADDTRDGYDPLPAPSTVATGVRAHLASPSAREDRGGGTRQALTARLLCDPVDLTHTDTVVDDTTGLEYAVVGVVQQVGFGLDHTAAGLLLVDGAGG
jgi:hypothetical protein